LRISQEIYGSRKEFVLRHRTLINAGII
jgi:hypothetical protein